MTFRVQRAFMILMLLLGCGPSVFAQNRRGPTPLENTPLANKTLENLLHQHAEATPVGTVSRPQFSSTEPAITAAWERYEKAIRAASAGLLQQIEKDLQRARPLSDGNATAGLEASKKAFVDQGSLPSMLNTGLRNARREVETAYRDASRMLHEQYDTTAAALRKANHEEDADAVVQEWALLHNMLELAQGPQLDSTWKHSIANGQSMDITLYSNGTINAPDGPDTWSLKGTTLVIRWQNPEAPGGAWVDTCEVAEHGGTYLGTNQLGTRISGVRLP